MSLKRYCRRCTHCECNRAHSRDHWTTRRAWQVALGTIALVLLCGGCCNWSTIIN